MYRCSVCSHVASEQFKFCPECRTPATAATAREERKVVTVLFCDLVGSTALGERLDPGDPAPCPRPLLRHRAMVERPEYLERHLIEETHHEEPGGAVLDDLEAAGVAGGELVAATASDKIATLLTLQHGWIRESRPVAVLGVLELEAHYTELPIVEKLIARSGLPRAAFGRLLDHARLDAMHGVHPNQMLDSLPLTPAQEQLVGLSALTTFRLGAEALLDTLARACDEQ